MSDTDDKTYTIADPEALRAACESKTKEESYRAMQETYPTYTARGEKYLHLEIRAHGDKNEMALQALPKDLSPTRDAWLDLQAQGDKVYDPQKPGKAFAIYDRAMEKLGEHTREIDRALRKLCTPPVS